MSNSNSMARVSEIEVCAATGDALQAASEPTKRTRTLIPFVAEKALARFSDETLAMVSNLVKENAKHELRATTTVEIAEAFFGHEKYKGIIAYMVDAQLSDTLSISHGPTGGVVPKGFEPTSGGRSVEVTDAFVSAVEASIVHCLAVAKRGGKKGASVDFVTMRLVEADMLNDGACASLSAVTAAIAKLSTRFAIQPKIGIVEVTQAAKASNVVALPAASPAKIANPLRAAR